MLGRDYLNLKALQLNQCVTELSRLIATDIQMSCSITKDVTRPVIPTGATVVMNLPRHILDNRFKD